MSWTHLEHVKDNIYRIVIKWWHPGFWAESYRTLRASGADPLSSTYYTVILVWHIARRNI